MDVLRTPDERFAKLEGYDFAPHYFTVTDEDGTPVRIHYVDEGPADAKPILLMHGNPTWAYLYRKMIRPLAAAGHRVIAVDLVGCGRSDKPARKADYTLARHYDWMSKWLTGMDLSGITLFCQDWGGTIGLYLTAKHPERFDRAIASNTGLPTGDGESEFMKMWVGMMRDATTFPLDQLLPGGMVHKPTAGELAAYNAPFPSDDYMAGIISFPLLIAVQPDNPGVPINKEAWKSLERFDKPFLTLFGELDPVAKGADKAMQARIPGARGQPHHTFPDAHHFIQEDVPDGLVEHILRFIATA
ncbi:haloalkane dehalogenase [Parvibaculum sp.]|uniref:haloalkane dehalogenase n=1 Tax=Parvibaculum sp. TaxID=2024848 RepID=UPI002730B550|nr:haloalkane dehalogenase [Parvibaculum sp.]MDP1626399.1 haloalkane dehalogenase [Parvibaculum sp.]MDP2150321.1 haloalkane dehalogenase [Parvibaculum sp.]MDP3329110.1 haloalkane dehalogenase [Parvibaculum sp.]